jgi:hypothetical protein
MSLHQAGIHSDPQNTASEVQCKNPCVLRNYLCIDIMMSSPCCPRNISRTKLNMAYTTIGLISTPKSGGVIFLMTFKNGSVGLRKECLRFLRCAQSMTRSQEVGGWGSPANKNLRHLVQIHLWVPGDGNPDKEESRKHGKEDV